MNETKTESKPVLYHLEIYEPNSERDVLIAFRTAAPFMAFAAGDVIGTRGWKVEGVPMRIGVRLVEHLIWELDTHVSHKIMVLTTKVADA
jgi:hypothetical protein